MRTRRVGKGYAYLLKLGEGEFEEIKRVATKCGVSMAFVISRAIKKFLKEVSDEC